MIKSYITTLIFACGFASQALAQDIDFRNCSSGEFRKTIKKQNEIFPFIHQLGKILIQTSELQLEKYIRDEVAKLGSDSTLNNESSINNMISEAKYHSRKKIPVEVDNIESIIIAGAIKHSPRLYRFHLFVDNRTKLEIRFIDYKLSLSITRRDKTYSQHIILSNYDLSRKDIFQLYESPYVEITDEAENLNVIVDINGIYAPNTLYRNKTQSEYAQLHFNSPCLQTQNFDLEDHFFKEHELPEEPKGNFIKEIFKDVLKSGSTDNQRKDFSWVRDVISEFGLLNPGNEIDYESLIERIKKSIANKK